MKRGYTLIEAVVVLTALAVIVAAAMPAFGAIRFGRNLERDRSGIVAVLRSAQSRAMVGEGDAPWGVRFSSDSYVLYKGPAYDAAAADSVRYALTSSRITAPAAFSASGGGTTDLVLFDKLRGTTSNVGTLTLVGGDGRTAVVTASAAGGIE